MTIEKRKMEQALRRAYYTLSGQIRKDFGTAKYNPEQKSLDSEDGKLTLQWKKDPANPTDLKGIVFLEKK